MATELASAYLTLIPTLKNAGKQIGAQLDGVDASGSGRKMGKQIGDGISTQMDASVKRGASGVTGTLKGVAGAAAGAFAAIGFGQLVAEAAAATDATQKFKSTLDFAGLDASAIDALTESTRKYADQTVYELSDIQGITAQLAANGVKDYDKLAEAAGNLNAAAGGNAETYKTVGMVMTQTSGLGKLTTENFNQLSEAVPGASGKLKHALSDMGAYEGGVDNFNKAMENGEISAEEFNQAIMELGFEDAAIEAAKSTATFEGAFGSLKAEVAGGLSDILTKLQPAITGAMNGVTAVVGPAFDLVIAGIDNLVSGVQSFGERMEPVFLSMAQAALDIAPLFEQIGGKVTGELAPALGNVGLAFEKVIEAVAPFAETIVSTVAPVVADIAGKVTDLATKISEDLAPIIEGIAQIVAAVMPAIQAAWTIAMNAIQGVIDAVWPYIEQVIGTAMTIIKDVINVVLAIINGDWGAVWEGIKTLLFDVWEGMKSLISGAIDAVKGVISTALGTIESIWDGAWSGISSFFGGIWDGIKQGASDGINAVIDAVSGIKDKITGFFSNAGQWLVDAGRNILQGLWDGISGAMGWLGDQLAGIGDFIVQHKGPPSYDRVMLVENGELIMRGLIDGIEGQKPALASALAGIGGQVEASATWSAPSVAGRRDEGASVVAWLDANLPAIIQRYTPVTGERDLARMARGAVSYA